ncbi:VOC family protein [Methylobacterium nodulans]|uniref:Glyoxalase/bleomycin resistance protein/dioxygenase n=1 Tax=Methylobacterium nodulans (strain LMG 21967 / CNCM I-2342 / ORS 2060) TaxID=460265 RepID=B8IDF5_METNO|nr:VOC family protein [Methylobacterium nodulans]ACL61321.1 Glyoxalase/bleomycin resistance protein/dioxygenase [Methylobacterium nodulans ORS 2060]
MFDPRISLITLGVADVARSTAFYESLGWTRSAASNPAITFIGLKGIVLALFSRASLAEDAGVEDAGRAPDAFPGMTLAHNLASEAEVDAAYAFALSKGARAVKPPQKVFWGGYSGYFADPDGYLWELAFNPTAPLDGNGHMTLPG